MINIENLYKSLQYYFNRKKIYKGKVDGVWGIKTKQAWQEWCFSTNGMRKFASGLPNYDLLPEDVQQSLLSYVVKWGKPEDLRTGRKIKVKIIPFNVRKHITKNNVKRRKVEFLLPNGEYTMLFEDEVMLINKYIKENNINTKDKDISLSKLLKDSINKII